MNKKILLLDMDGTITPPRGVVDNDMLSALMSAARYIDIGIVSGSDYKYMMEQCGERFINFGISKRISLLPCNGTKIYTHKNGELSYTKDYERSMIEYLGEAFYRDLISAINIAQAELIRKNKFTISGNFISYRGSTLNWSLIGRDSSKEQREMFANLKDKDAIRKEAIDILKIILKGLGGSVEDLYFSLGGQTSIDIFPKGWDKTYSLNHYKNCDIWFVGDKCLPGQNDFEIYNALKDNGQAYLTKSVSQTINIIDAILKDLNLEKKEYKLKNNQQDYSYWYEEEFEIEIEKYNYKKYSSIFIEYLKYFIQKILN